MLKHLFFWLSRDGEKLATINSDVCPPQYEDQGPHRFEWGASVSWDEVDWVGDEITFTSSPAN